MVKSKNKFESIDKLELSDENEISYNLADAIVALIYTFFRDPFIYFYLDSAFVAKTEIPFESFNKVHC